MAFGFARYDLTEITKRIDLPELSPDPARPMALIVKFAGVGNRDWEAARFMLDASRPADQKSDPGPDAEAIETLGRVAALQRHLERSARLCGDAAEVYAGTVLVGWEHVYDDESADPSQPVPFTADAARRFLVEMSTRVFSIWKRRFLDFVTDPANFRPAAIDAVDLGKG